MSKERSSPQKSKGLFPIIFQCLLIFVLSGIGGMSIGLLLNPLPSGYIWILIVLGEFSLAYYLGIILHEGGHFVMGRCTGYRFHSFRIGKWMWLKRGGKICFGRFHLPGTGGQCILIPPPAKEDGTFPTALYNWGGVLFNLASSVIALPLAILLRSHPYLSLFLIFFALMGLYSAAVNGIPFKGMMLANDAINARLMGESPVAMRALRLSHEYLQEAANGKRICELPDEWFVLPTEEEMQNSITTSVAVLACERKLSAEDYAGAMELMQALLAAPIALNDFHRNVLKMHLIVCLLLTEHSDDEVSRILTKELKNFIQILSTTLEGIVCQYALSMLWEKDSQKADAALRQFEKIRTHYPYPVEVEDAQRRLNRIRNKATELSAIPGVPPKGAGL